MNLTERIAGTRLERAAEMLIEGKLIAFPTETVFGLGADATRSPSVARIFEAKGRPSDNPLIVHLASVDQLPIVAGEIPEVAWGLLESFSPGPLTLVLKKQPAIGPLVTAGLETVAVRIPAHPVAHRLLELCRLPIAAPSANRSGKPSGTTWQSVLEDLDGRIDGIVCEDGCWLGIESTVLDLSRSAPRILRQGAITHEQLAAHLKMDREPAFSEPGAILSPGTRHPHYRPQGRVQIVDPMNLPSSDRSRAFIGLDPPKSNTLSWVRIVHDVPAYAASLYEFLRECDRHGIEEIYCQSVDDQGLGRALMDRLERAAGLK